VAFVEKWCLAVVGWMLEFEWKEFDKICGQTCLFSVVGIANATGNAR
jgi:hypothetical protein